MKKPICRIINQQEERRKKCVWVKPWVDAVNTVMQFLKICQKNIKTMAAAKFQKTNKQKKTLTQTSLLDNTFYEAHRTKSKHNPV